MKWLQSPLTTHSWCTSIRVTVFELFCSHSFSFPPSHSLFGDDGAPVHHPYTILTRKGDPLSEAPYLGFGLLERDVVVVAVRGRLRGRRGGGLRGGLSVFLCGREVLVSRLLGVGEGQAVFFDQQLDERKLLVRRGLRSGLGLCRELGREGVDGLVVDDSRDLGFVGFRTVVDGVGPDLDGVGPLLPIVIGRDGPLDQEGLPLVDVLRTRPSVLVPADDGDGIRPFAAGSVHHQGEQEAVFGAVAFLTREKVWVCGNAPCSDEYVLVHVLSPCLLKIESELIQKLNVNLNPTPSGTAARWRVRFPRLGRPPPSPPRPPPAVPTPPPIRPPARSCQPSVMPGRWPQQ